jgi:hypothetical protein
MNVWKVLIQRCASISVGSVQGWMIHNDSQLPVNQETPVDFEDIWLDGRDEEMQAAI